MQGQKFIKPILLFTSHLSNSQKNYLLIILILMLTVFSNLNLFTVPFIFDDYDFLFRWQTIRDFNHFPQLLLGDLPAGHEGVYRPVRSILYTISLNSFGHNLFFYHIQELIIYSLCVILVYLIIQKAFQNRNLSFLTALIYALLPIHIDNIANLTASFDTIGVIFFFLSFYSFQIYLNSKNNRTILLSTSLLSAAIAFFTYELTLILPFLLILYSFYKRTRISVKIYILFISAVILYLIIRTSLHIPLRGSYSDNLQSKIISITQSVASLPIYSLSPIKVDLPTTSSNGYFLFSGTNEREINQNADNQIPLFFISMIFLITIIILSIHSFLRRQITGFSLIWFFTCIIPAIAISLQSNLTGEGQILWGKYIIIASLGSSLLLANWLIKLTILNSKSQKDPISPLYHFIKILCLVSIIILILIYPLYNIYNLNNWREPYSIILNEIAKKADNEEKHNDLGIVYAMKGNYTEAITEFKKALLINPAYTKSRQNLIKLCQIIKTLSKSLSKAEGPHPDRKTISQCPTNP